MREAVFLDACLRRPTPYTPIWLMRQAGRYMPEYRAIRKRVAFLDLCKDSDLAGQVTLDAVERLGVDAAILFSDILLILEPLGVGLEFTKGDGPVIKRPIRTGSDIEQLPEVSVVESLFFVYETIAKIRHDLTESVPLIGFSGAPFTLASYMIEGGGSRHYQQTKHLMYSDKGAWDALVGRLVDIIAGYVNAQINAGAQVIQLFDSWIGALGPADYESYILPHMQRLFRLISPGIPTVHFGTGTSGLLELLSAAGGDVIGVDWRIDLSVAWKRIGGDRAVQGNLDPLVLFAPLEELRAHVRRVLREAGGRPGHIFNLGHGILPDTPVDNVVALVDMVHEYSQR